MTTSIKVIKKSDDFILCQEVWNSVLNDMDRVVPFLSFEWVSSWWTAFGRGKSLYVVMVHENDKCIGIAPFYLVRRGLVRYLELIGGDRADYLDFVVRNNKIEVFFDALYEFLKSASSCWDVVLLKNICWDKKRKNMYKTQVSSVGFFSLSRHYTQAPYLSISGNWESYLKLYSISKKIRKKERRLLKNGNFEIVKLSDFESSLFGINVFEVIKAIEKKSWKYLAGNPRLQTSKEAEVFFEMLLRKFCSQGWIDIWFLLSDGVPKAYALNFVLHNTVFAYNSAYDEGCRHFGIGALLHINRIRDAFNCGRVEYDFLRGTESYKREWTNTQRDIEEYAIFHYGLRSCLIARFILWLRWYLSQVMWVKNLRYKIICSVNRFKR